MRQEIVIGDPEIQKLLEENGIEVTIERRKLSGPVISLRFPDTHEQEGPLCSSCNANGITSMCDLSSISQGVEFIVRNQRSFMLPDKCPRMINPYLPDEELPEGCINKLEHEPYAPYLALDPEQLSIVGRFGEFIRKRFATHGIKQKIINPSVSRVKKALQ